MKHIVLGILAHVDAGKTTLAEALLYAAGEIKHLGRVDRRDAFLDTHALERARGITIFAKQALLSLPEVSFTLLDTPGHVDFSAEMERTLSVLDYAILVISGTDGVQAHTETLWKLLKQYGIPTFCFITKMDLAGADKAARMRELKAQLSPGCIDFSAENRAARAEELAMLDDALLESYLETNTVSLGETAELIRRGVCIPCFFGSGLRLDGVEVFLDALRVLCKPRPTELNPTESAAFSARVYKISRDAQGNRMTWMRLTGGTLRVRSAVDYLPEGENEPLSEKATQLRLYSGEKYETVEEAVSGQCIAVLGLSKTASGMGFGTSAASVPVLEPVMSYRVLPQGEEPRTFLPKLRRLAEEDPQLHIVWDARLQEIHAQLMGEVQIEVLRALVKSRFDEEITVDEGRILYKETVAAPVEGVGHYEPLRHYAEVHVLLEPLPRGSGVTYAADCDADSLDTNWQRLILTHLAEKVHVGVLTGSPLTDVRLTLLAGRAHPKHTEGGDFRQATYRAVRQGLMQAKSVLLEPVFSFSLSVPAEQIGRAISDVQAMNGTFLPPEEDGEMMRLCGTAPVSEMRGYPAVVTAYTHGRGRFSATVSGYAPCHNTEAVLRARNYQPEADADNSPDSIFCAHGAGFLVKWDRVFNYMHLDSGLRTVTDADGQPVLRRPTAQDTAKIYTRNLHIEQKELDAILARTFGSSGNPTAEPRPAPPEKEVVLPEWKHETLIVDGYNVLFAWDCLQSLAQENLDAARGKLMDMLSNYRGFTECTFILVFDGYRRKENPGESFDYHGIQVVFTKENETADLYIERLVGEIGKNERVRVVTSDNMIRLAALRFGVLRMPARELESRIVDFPARQTEKHPLR